MAYTGGCRGISSGILCVVVWSRTGNCCRGSCWWFTVSQRPPLVAQQKRGQVGMARLTMGDGRQTGPRSGLRVRHKIEMSTKVK